MSGNDGFIERLVVGLGFATDQASLQQVMGEFRGAFDALTGYAGALLAAAGAGVAFTLVQASAMDETAKLAQQLRTTTEELTALQFAASRSGVRSTELTESMRKLDASLGQAASGAGPAAEALAAMGLSATNADGSLRSSVGSMADIADGLLRIEDEGERARALIALFGEQGARLRPLLAGGAEGVRALTDEAVRLGLVLDSKTAAAAEKLMDSTENLRGVVRGLGWQVAAVLIPPLTRTVEGLTAWLTAQDGIVHGGLDRFLRGLSWTIEQLETPTGKAVAGMTVLAGVIGAGRGVSAAASAMSAVPVLGRLGTALGALASGPVLLVTALLVGAALAIEDMIVFAQGGDSALGRFFDRFGDYDHALGSTTALLDEMQRSGGAVVDIVRMLSDSVGNELAVAFGDALPPMGKVLDYIIRFGEADRLQKKIDTWVAGFRLLGDTLELIAEHLDPKSVLGSLVFGATGGRAGLGMMSEGILGVEGVPDSASAGFGALLGDGAGALSRRVEGLRDELGPLGTRNPAEQVQTGGGDVSVSLGGVAIQAGARLEELADQIAAAVRARFLAEDDIARLYR